jgi:phosphatidate cytidylyltransferase
MGTLRTRVITASVLGFAWLAIVLYLPRVVAIIGVTIAILAGAWEWSAFLRTSRAASRAAYVVLIAVLMPIACTLTGSAAAERLFFLCALAWWLIALVWIVVAPRRATPAIAAFAGLAALVPAWLALLRLRQLQDGAQWLLFVLILVWAADVGAFFIGRRFGKHKLAPAVSPGKTWEGVIGGVCAGALVAWAGAFWFSLPLASFLPLCLIVVCFSIVGDLTESLLKRFAGIKDSGRLIPGHGGVMDRIDSVTGAAPTLFLGLGAMGLLP